MEGLVIQVGVDQDKHQHQNDNPQNNNKQITQSPEQLKEHGLTANYLSLCNNSKQNKLQMDNMVKVLQ